MSFIHGLARGASRVAFPWRAGGEERATVHLEPIELAELLEQVAGKWVALVDGEIVAVGETMDAVVMQIHDARRRPGATKPRATIIRAPGEAEAELVGLG